MRIQCKNCRNYFNAFYSHTPCPNCGQKGGTDTDTSSTYSPPSYSLPSIDFGGTSDDSSSSGSSSGSDSFSGGGGDFSGGGASGDF